MRVIKLHNGIKSTVEYPRLDMKPVENLAKDIEFYFIVDSGQPDYDRNTHTVKRVERLTDEKNKQYPHLKNAYINYDIIQLSNERIIENLNNSVGALLDADNGYPVWKRIKHEGELRQGTTPEREVYIQSLKDWEQACRKERNRQEFELINNNQLPSFKWPLKPK